MHRIGKTFLDVQVRGKTDGLELQKQLTQQCENELWPALEALFDRLAGPGEMLVLDQLEVNVRDLPPGRWQDVLILRIVEAVEEAIRRKLNSPLAEERVERRTLAAANFELWLYFLENGTLPLPGGIREADLQQSALDTIAAHTPAMQAFGALLRRADHALQRLVWQHPESFHRALVEAYAGPPAAALLGWRDHTADLLTAALAMPAQKRRSGAVRQSLATLETVDRQFSHRFWETAWSSFLLPERVFDAAAFIEILLRKSLREVDMPVAIALLRQTVEAAPTRFSAWRPVLQTLAEKWPAPLALSIGEARLALPSPVEAPTADRARRERFVENRDMPSAHPQDPGPEPSAPALVKSPESPAPERPASRRPADQPPAQPEFALQPGATPETTAERPPAPTLPSGQDIAPKKKPEPPAAASETPTRPDENAYWYVQNAGVILLHPFLTTYFKSLGLTDDNRFCNEAAQHQAIGLLHYLATGERDAPEYELVFAKFLCGLDLESPLLRWTADDHGEPPATPPAQKARKTRKKRTSENAENQSVTDRYAEGEQLLEAAIRHWGKLGSSSPDGLRQGFLRRSGKLSYRPFDGWLLQVEQSGIDILLDYLPWGLSIVKLPWMPELLHVEWVTS